MNGKARADARAAGGSGMFRPRLSRAESRRLLAGRPVRSDRNLGLELLLAAAAAPEPATAASDEAGLAAVLEAFSAAPPARLTGARSRHRSAAYPMWSRAFIVKSVAALILLCGASAAAAAADVLPGPVQHIAHSVFGELGVPAPQTSTSPGPNPAGRTPTQGPSPLADPAGTTDPAVPTPTTTGTSPAALCEAAARSWSTWRSTLSPRAMAQLIAQAGGIQKVVPYCARVLGGLGGSTSTSTRSASPTATAPSASPTAVYGRRGYPTHAPTNPSTYDPTRYYKSHR